jgi:hypothetical protein
MSMILDGIDQNRRATYVPQNPSHVAVQRSPDLIGNDPLPFFGAENKVDVQANERLWHRPI